MGHLPAHYREKGISARSLPDPGPAGRGPAGAVGVGAGPHTRPDLKVGICGEHGGDPTRSVLPPDRSGLRELLALPGARRRWRPPRPGSRKRGRADAQVQNGTASRGASPEAGAGREAQDLRGLEQEAMRRSAAGRHRRGCLRDVELRGRHGEPDRPLPFHQRRRPRSRASRRAVFPLFRVRCWRGRLSFRPAREGLTFPRRSGAWRAGPECPRRRWPPPQPPGVGRLAGAGGAQRAGAGVLPGAAARSRGGPGPAPT